MKKVWFTVLMTTYVFRASIACALDIEFQINTTQSANEEPWVATNGTNYMVVWAQYGDGSMYGVYGRLYTSTGSALTPEFLLNSYTSLTQHTARVASNGSDYLVVWQSQSEYNTFYGLVGRIIENDGTMSRLPFQVSDQQYSNYNDVASNGTNYYVVFCNSSGVFGRLITDDGSAVTVHDEQQLMYFDDASPVDTHIASDGDNYMVLADFKYTIEGESYVIIKQHAVRVNGSTGFKTGEPFEVCVDMQTYVTTTHFFGNSDIGWDGSQYVAVWNTNDPYTHPDDFIYDIYARHITSSGDFTGPAFRVNDHHAGSQDQPGIGTIPGYGVCALWISQGTPDKVMARPIGSDGNAQSSDLQLNTTVNNEPEHPEIASNGNTVFGVYNSDHYAHNDIYGVLFGDDDADNDTMVFLREWFVSTDPNDKDTDNDWVDDNLELDSYFTDPLNDDTDGDFLRDAMEIYLYGSNPNLVDSDSDGLTDSEELLSVCTDPLDADSDDDGLTDAQEVWLHGTDPNNADSDSDGYTDSEEVIAGTDPNDGLDYLEITRFDELSQHLGVSVVFIGWNSAPGKKYRVYVQSDMIGPKFVLLENNVVSRGYQTFYMDQGGGPNGVPHPSAETGTRLYKVVVQP